MVTFLSQECGAGGGGSGGGREEAEEVIGRRGSGGGREEAEEVIDISGSECSSTMWDDECGVCGEAGGQLLCCEGGGCSAVFHKACIG